MLPLSTSLLPSLLPLAPAANGRIPREEKGMASWAHRTPLPGEQRLWLWCGREARETILVPWGSGWRLSSYSSLPPLTQLRHSDGKQNPSEVLSKEREHRKFKIHTQSCFIHSASDMMQMNFLCSSSSLAPELVFEPCMKKPYENWTHWSVWHFLALEGLLKKNNKNKKSVITIAQEICWESQNVDSQTHFLFVRPPDN